jgi:TusA-related sulfurtransferase
METREQVEEEKEFANALEISAVGQACPGPVVTAFKAVKQVKVGEVVHLTASDPGCERDIPAWAKMSGQEIIRSWKDENGIFHFLIKRAK